MKLLLNLSVGAGIEMGPNRINEKKISGEGDHRIRFSGSLFSISTDNAQQFAINTLSDDWRHVLRNIKWLQLCSTSNLKHIH